MYSIFLICLFNGLLGNKLENGHCNKEDGCDSENPGKPVILEDLKRSKRNTYPPIHDKLYVIRDDQMPVVLWWHDNIYPHSQPEQQISCPLGTCLVTKNREKFNNLLTRGLIFYGTSFENEDLPLPRLPYHEWALIHEESPKNNWMFSSELGISIFNHTATFRRESDYPMSTQFLRSPDLFFDNKFFVDTKTKNRLQKELGLAPLVYVQRDCNPPSDRDTYVRELMKYIDIDSYGDCVNNKKMPENIDGFHKLSTEEYYHFLARYKFQLAMENAICSDYMTEKIFRPLETGSVPIYLGSDRIQDFMPSKKSVILVSDFDSVKSLAEYLIELNADDTKYDEYLAHRYTGKISNPELHKSIDRQPWKVSKHNLVNFGHFMFAEFSCYICDRLHERNNHLKENIKDQSVSPLPIKFANSSHMGCPLSHPIFGGKAPPNKELLLNVKQEAEALIKMFLANETDSSKWKRYKEFSPLIL